MVVKVGEIYPSNNNGDMEVIEYLGARNITIKFLDTGIIKYKVSSGNLFKGKIGLPRVTEATPVTVGDVFPSKNHGDMRIVEYISCSNITVCFLSTNTNKTGVDASKIRTGSVAPDTYSLVKVGGVYPSNKWGDMEVLSYRGAEDITIKFTDTGSIRKNILASKLRNGKVKDFYGLSIQGVGYQGVGKYTKTTRPKIYQTWSGMLERCYSEKSLIVNPSYKGCTVVNPWHNLQVFAVWFEENYIEGYQLDKDIKVPGNKVYGPDTCMFVTLAKNVAAARATTVVLRSPTGERVEVYNISKFAGENGLHAGQLSAIKTGKEKQHKGWTLWKEGGQ